MPKRSSMIHLSWNGRRVPDTSDTASCRSAWSTRFPGCFSLQFVSGRSPPWHERVRQVGGELRSAEDAADERDEKMGLGFVIGGFDSQVEERLREWA